MTPSHFRSGFPVPAQFRAIYCQWFDRFDPKMNPGNRRLTDHLFRSGHYNRLNKDRVEVFLRTGDEMAAFGSQIPIEVIRRKAGYQADPRDLVGIGIARADNSYQVGEYSRTYLLVDPPELIITPDQIKHDDWVNLSDGRPIRRPTRTTKFTATDRNRNQYPALIQRNLDRLNSSIAWFNDEAIEIHVASLEQKMKEEIEGSAEWLKARQRWQHDLHCWNAVRLSAPENQIGPILLYRPRYVVQDSGRFSAKFYGVGRDAGYPLLQSCTRTMKRAAYRSLSLKVFNYDLRRCHLKIVQLDLDRIHEDSAGWTDQRRAEILHATRNFDHFLDDLDSTLEQFLSIGSKLSFTKDVDLRTRAFKQIPLSYVNGAWLPYRSQAKWFRPGCKSIPSTIKLLINDCGFNTEDSLDAALKFLHRELAGFLAATRYWHRYMLTVYIPKHIDRGVFRNAVQMPLKLPHYKAPKGPGAMRKKVKKIIFHYLQGRERQFILTLSDLLHENNIRILSDEHDGLITDSPIPSKLIEIAKEKSGYRNAEFVLKNI